MFKEENFSNVLLTDNQADRLSKLTSINSDEIIGKSIIDLERIHKHRIDPKLFLFKKICGKVVKKDAVSGDYHPVPFAKVHVEDTDCRFLGIFPTESPFAWFLPVSCKREEITTATTDECGKFCVWVPRFEIDWILKWRKERFCFLDLLVKPSIKDIFEKLLYEPPKIKKPFPEPDPLPVTLINNPGLISRAESYIGRTATEKLASEVHLTTIGDNIRKVDEIGGGFAFDENRMTVLPEKLQKTIKKAVKRSTRSFSSVRGVSKKRININRLQGPFIRCIDFVVPEIKWFADVPDITFRVTQDVNGDGDEENIYSESFFDIRWNESSIPDVTLVASEIALTSVSCEVPEVSTEGLGIQFAGLMPIGESARDYHNNTSGYAIRPNRPHPSCLFNDPLPNPDAETPFKGTLQLYGNNQHADAKYYRISYQHNESHQTHFSHTWKIYKVDGGVLHKRSIAPDESGWYEIIPSSENWHPHDLLMNWPTGAVGKYQLKLELANTDKEPLSGNTSAVSLQVDNSKPVPLFKKLEWRVDRNSWETVDMKCAVIKRPSGQNIEIRVSFEASGTHYRSVKLSGWGCGGGNPVLTSAASTAEHWHKKADNKHFDNSGDPAIYHFPSTLPQGAYRFDIQADSRSFNPAGGDAGTARDNEWEYDPTDLYRKTNLPISIVDI